MAQTKFKEIQIALKGREQMWHMANKCLTVEKEEEEENQALKTTHTEVQNYKNCVRYVP